MNDGPADIMDDIWLIDSLQVPRLDARLILRHNLEYYWCSMDWPWEVDRDMSKYFILDPDDTTCISPELALPILKKFVANWKKHGVLGDSAIKGGIPK